MPGTSDLVRTVAAGRVYDLEQPRMTGMPIHPAHRPGYSYHLHRRHRITPADLEAASRLAEVTVRPGDALLVRTGYAKLWNDEARYLRAAGVSVEGSKWAASKRVRCVGCDNMTWDETEERDPESGATLFGHLHLLARSGIPIIENLDLEALSRDRVREFLFICTPLKFVGATGSPVRPIAVA